MALVISEGSKARYLVREQLARISFPSDAVGETDGVRGVIVFDANGIIQPDRSSIVVNMAGLRSDAGLRDSYLRRNTLQTSRYPDAEFVVKTAPGLPWPLPASGEVEFRLIGDMTIRGVTKQLTWDVKADFGGGGASAQAETSFKFGYFGLEVPRVRLVLSVVDEIRLELDLAVAYATGP
jgi:polyisoprenoid-binding protein YceI